jgi:hypothetical protein
MSGLSLNHSHRDWQGANFRDSHAWPIPRFRPHPLCSPSAESGRKTGRAVGFARTGRSDSAFRQALSRALCVRSAPLRHQPVVPKHKLRISLRSKDGLVFYPAHNRNPRSLHCLLHVDEALQILLALGKISAYIRNCRYVPALCGT